MTNKKSISLAIILFVMILFIAAIAIPSGSVASAHNISSGRFEPSEFSDLTYGIYWYTENSDMPIAAAKATNFDPKKPTIIYAHGMKTSHEGLDCREGLSLKDESISSMNEKGFDDYAFDEEFYRPLIRQGYNVGVFFWNQMADCLFTEDNKFWTATNLLNGNRYSYIDENGEYKYTSKSSPKNPTVTVTKLYRDCLIEALGEDFSGHLQLTGHSMGGQLTLAVSQALCAAYDRGEISSAYLPDRVTLFDPYLGASLCNGILDTTGEVLENKYSAALAAEAAEMVANHGIPIEAYGSVNEGLIKTYRYYASPLSGIQGELFSEKVIYYCNGIMPDAEGMTTEAFVELIREEGLDEETIAEWIRLQEEVDRISKLFEDNIAWVFLDAMWDVYKNFTPTHVMSVDYYFTTMYLDPAYDNGGVEIPSFKASDAQIRALKGKAFSQWYDTTKSKPNPIYQNESVYTRVDGFARKETAASALPAVLNGTFDTDEAITVKLMKGSEVVAETSVLKGNYSFVDVKSGEYTIVFTNKKDKDVATIDNVTVSSTERINTVNNDNIQYITPAASGSVDTGFNKTLGMIVGIATAVILVGGLLIAIIVFFATRRRRI